MHAAPTYDHLQRLTTPLGLFEHALGPEPRREHGYCLDDVARGLVLTAREPGPPDGVQELTETYLRFVLVAQDGLGRFHNRRDEHGRWTDAVSVEDHWGRALWALGTAAASDSAAHVRGAALGGALRSMRLRSPWWHAMAYAALGAAEVLVVRPTAVDATDLLRDARTLLRRPAADVAWPWPDARLTYANALLPEALIAIGVALDDRDTLGSGLDLLRWLVELETRGGHLSLTPAGGWAPGETRPGFDQQPIEVAALAEACWRAFRATSDIAWLELLDRCAAWFFGANDAGAVLYDRTSGGGYDGLLADGVNINQGAESTLAALSTLQLARISAVQTVS